MLLPLPNLDDRRWSDLVEEGRALIPVYDRTWTDHNIHDPGIMLVELMAWITEMDVYWLNRIPESRLLKFLALAGFYPAPPRAARAVLQLRLADEEDPLPVPVGLVFEGDDLLRQAVPFRTLTSLTVAPGRLAAVMRDEGDRWVDLTERYERGEAYTPLGDDPAPGVVFYLGFDRPLPQNVPVSLYVTLSGADAGDAARQRLSEWQAERISRCGPPEGLLACPPAGPCLASGKKTAEAVTTNNCLVEDKLLWHPCVRLCWEYLDAGRRWQPLDPAAGQVWDDTRSLTLSGRIVVCLPGPMADAPLGRPARRLYFLRCRLESGAFDAPPIVENLALNGVRVEQATNAGAHTWLIAAGAQIEGPEPVCGQAVGFAPTLNAAGWITHLTFEPGGLPGVRLLAYRAPQDGAPGQLTVQAEPLDPGDGRPDQVRALAHKPVQAESLELYTWEEGRWLPWKRMPDLDAAGRADAHYVLDAEGGELHFGDGERGRVLQPGAVPLASYRATRALEGNLPAGAIVRLAESAHNRALAGNLQSFCSRIEVIHNPLPAAGGAPAEGVDEAAARALFELGRPTRAVTLQDMETLALETPGTRLARAAALPDLHPAYPCLRAPGIVTLVVLPFLPARRPEPSPCLIRAVSAYLSARRVVGTHVRVVGPLYVPVTVRARVQANAGAEPTAVRARVIEALERFFHPLSGGPEGDGWPFGRDVYRSEVLQIMDETPGVDHVLSLELIGAGGEPSCGNLCLGPLGLVAAGEHEIEVN